MVCFCELYFETNWCLGPDMGTPEGWTELLSTSCRTEGAQNRDNLRGKLFDYLISENFFDF